MAPDDLRHGSTRGYHAGCRQPCCKRALAAYEKRTKHRRANGIVWAIPAFTVQRRLQALIAMGWTAHDITTALGWCSRNRVWFILKGQKGKPTRYVERKTYRAICELYERMCMTLPPTDTTAQRINVTRSRNLAKRNGWPVPLAWSNIDDPDERPHGWQYTPATRLETFTELVERGAGVSELCRHLGLTRAALQKWAANNGLSAEFRAACGREHNYSTSANGGAA